MLCQDIIEKYRYDPYGFIMNIYEWGKFPLVPPYNHKLENWQAEYLMLLGSLLQTQIEKGKTEPIKIALAAGKGPGKTALLNWIEHWAISCFPHGLITVTGSSAMQLAATTWREIAKWKSFAKNGDDFEWTLTKKMNKESPETWFSKMTPWNITRVEAFQGRHEYFNLFIVDEASAVHDLICEAIEETLTDEHGLRLFLMFSNPTRNTGYFRRCFLPKSGWLTRHIDCRYVNRTDKKEIEKKIAQYGLDDDRVRRSVLGLFPRNDSNRLIEDDVINASTEKYLLYGIYKSEPKIIGLDVAYEGDDSTVSIKRQGLWAGEIKSIRNKDPLEVAEWVRLDIQDWDADIVVVDSIGIGEGVLAALKRMRLKCLIMGCKGSYEAKRSDIYANQRTENYFELKDWLVIGGTLANCKERDLLVEDLQHIFYTYESKKAMRWLIQSKKFIKGELRRSPDYSDALQLTFAVKKEIRRVDLTMEDYFKKQNLLMRKKSNMFDELFKEMPFNGQSSIFKDINDIKELGYDRF